MFKTVFIVEIKCGWRSRSRKASEEKTFSCTCRTTGLWSSGISGLFLNNDEVLTHGFRSGFLSLGLAQDSFGEKTSCAFPLKVLCVPPAVVFLDGREDVWFLCFAGGPSLNAWCFLLVACACRLAWVVRDLENILEEAAGGSERWRSTPSVTAMAGGEARPHAGKPGAFGPREPVPRPRAHVGRARGPRVAAPPGPAAAPFPGPAGPAPTGDRSRGAGATGWARDAGRGGVAVPLGVPCGLARGRLRQVTLNPRAHACKVLWSPQQQEAVRHLTNVSFRCRRVIVASAV